jgi:hypothetical protein
LGHDGGVHRLALALLVAALAVPASASASTGILERAAAKLRADPVYVDPAARNVVGTAQERRIEREIANAGAGQVYIAILPPQAASEAGGDPAKALRTIAQTLHRRGTYAAVIGNHFRAGSNVLPRGEAAALATEAFTAHHTEGVTPTLVAFVDRVAAARANDGGGSGGGGGGGGSKGGGNGWVIFVLIGGGLVLFWIVRSRSRRRAQEAELATVKQVAREDLVALAEDVQELEHRVDGSPAASAAYGRALASYERASGAFDRVRSPQELAPVAKAIDDGRYEMSVAEAEIEGRQPPERRPPCFFDPRHGPSTRDVEWSPDGGAPRSVPACEADALRVEQGEQPESRQVPVGGAMVPYWAAPPAYGGYFGGFLPGLLLGQMMFAGWGFGGGYSDAGGAYDSGGGQDSGGGFDSGDFGGGGGGGDFGGGGGGDFGGGGGGDF